MLTINDFVKMGVQQLPHGLQGQFDLDQNMPPYGEGHEDTLSGVFAHSVGELVKHSRQYRITTKLDVSTQIVWIDTDHRIEEATLADLNGDLEAITQGTMKWESGEARGSGNRLAAQHVHTLSGKMYLETIDDPPYQTRTVIEIPVPTE